MILSPLPLSITPRLLLVNMTLQMCWVENFEGLLQCHHFLLGSQVKQYFRYNEIPQLWIHFLKTPIQGRGLRIVYFCGTFLLLIFTPKIYILQFATTKILIVYSNYSYFLKFLTYHEFFSSNIP